MEGRYQTKHCRPCVHVSHGSVPVMGVILFSCQQPCLCLLLKPRAANHVTRWQHTGGVMFEMLLQVLS
jgi:hypothetical protein